MTPDEVMAALGRVAVFRDFTETGLRIFATVAAEKKIPAGSPIFVEGMAGESMLIVVRGTVRLMQRQADGAEREVGRLGPGEPVGELAVLAPSVRLVTAIAVDDCVVLEITQRDFLRLAPQKPQACLKLATAVAALIARRAAEARELLRDALRGPPGS